MVTVRDIIQVFPKMAYCPLVSLPHRPRVGRAQLYRLSLVDAHTVAQNQCMGKKIDNIHFVFVMALCYVQKCELSYNVLGSGHDAKLHPTE